MEDKLVSIIVITYNSAQYVLETLESAKAQTYNNIELIISDDCSTDSTASVCKKWIDINEMCFVRVELVTAPMNSGVCANANRGLKAARGEWIKILGGDDMLMPDAVESYLNYMPSTSSRFIFAFPSIFMEPLNASRKTELENFYINSKSFKLLPPSEQFKFLLINRIPVNPPTLFCSRDALIQLDGFDERYTCEDLPMFLRATRNGFHLDIMEKKTINYRIHNKQLSTTENEELVHKGWFYEQWKIKKEYFTLKYIIRNPKLFVEYLIENLSKYIILKTGNRRGSLPFHNYLSSVKSNIRFSYISKVK